jgi:hypothetical protein
MKYFLGRISTTLITIGCALLLVSIVPSAKIESFVGGNLAVWPQTFSAFHESSYYSGDSGFVFFERFPILTPQQELQLNIESNGTLQAYLVDGGTLRITYWIQENHPEQNIYSSDFFYAPLLTEFLTLNPDAVLWQKEIQSGVNTIEYTPVDVINASLIFSNPSSDKVIIKYDGAILKHLAPVSRVQTAGFSVVLIGCVLAAPYLLAFKKKHDPKFNHFSDSKIKKRT